MAVPDYIARAWASARAAEAARARAVATPTVLAAAPASTVVVRSSPFATMVDVGDGYDAMEEDGLPSAANISRMYREGVSLAPSYLRKLKASGPLPSRSTSLVVGTTATLAQPSTYVPFRQWAPAQGSTVQQLRAAGPAGGGAIDDFEVLCDELNSNDAAEEAVEPSGVLAGDARDKALRLAAARELLAMPLPSQCFGPMLGTDAEGLAGEAPDVVQQDVLDHLCRLSPSKLRGMLSVLRLLRAFLTARRGRSVDAALVVAIPGFLIVRFLDDVAAVAMARQASRPTSRGGATAAPRRAAQLKACVHDCGFVWIDVVSPTVLSWCREHKVSPIGAEQAVPIEDAMVLWLHATVDCHADSAAGGTAAMFLAVMYFVLRDVLASRSGGVARVGDCAVGHAGFDYKKPPGTPGRQGRPMVASAAGVDGSDWWLQVFMESIDAVAGRYFMVRDTDSPDGDPYKATGWGSPAGGERPQPYKRQLVALRALLAAPLPIGAGGALVAPPYSQAEVNAVTLHSLKRKVPIWTAIAFPASPDALLETGAWAGAALAAMDSGTARRIATGLPVALHYAAESVAMSAHSVALRTTDLVARWLFSLRPAFPPSGEASRIALAAFRDRLRSPPQATPSLAMTPPATVVATLAPAAAAAVTPGLVLRPNADPGSGHSLGSGLSAASGATPASSTSGSPVVIPETPMAPVAAVGSLPVATAPQGGSVFSFFSRPSAS